MACFLSCSWCQAVQPSWWATYQPNLECGLKEQGWRQWACEDGGQSQGRETCWIAFYVSACPPMLCSPCMTSQEVQPQCEAWQRESGTAGKQNIMEVRLIGVSWPETQGLGLLPVPLCEVGIRIFPVPVDQKVVFSIVSSWAEKGLTCCQNMLSLGLLNFTNLLKSVYWGS